MKRVIIIICSGEVGLLELPPGIEVIIRNYDVLGVERRYLDYDDDGDAYYETRNYRAEESLPGESTETTLGRADRCIPVDVELRDGTMSSQEKRQ